MNRRITLDGPFRRPSFFSRFWRRLGWLVCGAQ